MTGFDTVVSVLEAAGMVVSSTDDAVRAKCPAHEDDRPSLSVGQGDGGKALVYCFAGCDTSDVIAALDLTWDSLATGRDPGSAIAATYVYRNVSGDPLYRVLRTSPKGFWQQRYEDGEYKDGMRNVTRVLYRLNDLVRLDLEETVYVVEGEKDCDSLAEVGAFGTTKGGGTVPWTEADAEMFTDRTVVIIPDNDDAGRASGERIAALLRGTVRSAQVLYAATGKDVTDHLLAGHGLDELVPESSGIEVFEEWDPWEYETPDDEWLWEPYIPVAGRVLVYGPSGSLKSLWAAWLGAHLAAEGKKVAYFSLEMGKRQYAKRVRQLPAHPKQNLRHFGAFMFGQNLGTAIKNFEGYDLLIVDSWSQAQGDMGSNDNDAISAMDKDFFQPLIAATGATVLIIDNTGKDGKDQDGGRVRNDEARGASRKKDIQETAWWLYRPDEGNNFRVRVLNRKMRLDRMAPAPMTIETPQDRIEFYTVESGVRSGNPFWPSMQIESDGSERILPTLPDGGSSLTTKESPSGLSSVTPVSEGADPTGLASYDYEALDNLMDAFKGGMTLRERATLRSHMKDAEVRDSEATG